MHASAIDIDLFVIGAMKSATTSMCDWLDSQPDFQVSKPKEPSIFVSDTAVREAVPRLGEYFPEAPHRPVRVDGSTDYAKFPAIAGVPARVRRHCPEARFVYLMRDPIARAISQYRFEWLLGGSRVPFERALVERPELIDNGRYGLQLAQWLEHFPADRFLLVFAEAFAADEAEQIGRVRRFLQVPPEPQTMVGGDAPSNDSSLLILRSSRARALRRSPAGRIARRLVPSAAANAYKQRVQARSVPEVSETVRAHLAEIFDQDLVEFQTLTAGPLIDCASWRDVALSWTPCLRTS